MKPIAKYNGRYNKQLLSKIDRALEEITTEIDIAIATNEIYQTCAYDKGLTRRLNNTLEANAYNVVVSQLQYALLLTLFRIWDNHPQSSVSLPRTIEMLTRGDVQSAVINRQYHWASDPKHRKIHTFDNEDPEKRKLIEGMWLASLPERGANAAKDTQARVNRCLRMANHKSLDRLRESLKRFRNKAIAHMPDRRAPIWQPSKVVPLKNGDEKIILERTLRIVTELNLSVRGTGFDFADTRKIWRSYSRAFWKRM